LRARCGNPGAYEQVIVRLAEIDAPEKAQAFGQRSKEHLSSLCFNLQATIKPIARDRYGRTVARVECRGKDANVDQVRAGMAWAYTRYQTDPQFSPLERRARAARAGLWRDSAPIAPWEFRRAPPATIAPEANGCIIGPKGGRYMLLASGQKRYGC
ncbi:MAG: hypothetical protein EON54_17770, partial [Alcaligenaceae bacterium]